METGSGASVLVREFAYLQFHFSRFSHFSRTGCCLVLRGGSGQCGGTSCRGERVWTAVARVSLVVLPSLASSQCEVDRMWQHGSAADVITVRRRNSMPRLPPFRSVPLITIRRCPVLDLILSLSLFCLQKICDTARQRSCELEPYVVG